MIELLDGGRSVTCHEEVVFPCNPEPIREHGQAFAPGVHNMIDLPYPHLAGVLHNLGTRFANNLIYTYSGSVLITVNPGKVRRSFPVVMAALGYWLAGYSK